MLAGGIVAGPLVRLACERHHRERVEAETLGLRFDDAAADRVLAFFEQFLRLPDTTGPDGNPLAFILQPWQAFIVSSLFGWKFAASGLRRYRNAYIEIGKGNGKTPLCAGIGLYGLLMDGQKAPEIYAAAVDRDQAQIMFRDAVRMVDCSPDLAGRIRKSGENPCHNMAYGLGFFRPFSREQGAKSGTRPHMGLIDELHEHPGPDIVNKMRAGAKGNMNAMFVEITNSGFDRASVCFQHHEHSRRILERTVQDDRWFAYVCALDEGDDPLNDPSCWPKVNPNQGVSIHREYLQDQVAAAKHIPAETNTVLRLNFCIWTQAQSRFIDMPKWHQCDPRIVESELIGAPCYAALDLGQSDDLTAFVLIWLLEDGRVAVRARFWMPEATLERRPNRPYAEWKRASVLETTEGEIVDYGRVQDAVERDCLQYGVLELAYDKRFAAQMAQNLEGKGIVTVDTPQGFQLNEALRKLSDLVTDGMLVHGGNPLLGWMAANAVVRHGRSGEIRLDKEKAPEKIDGIAALTMALSRLIVAPVGESKYEREALYTL